MDDDPTMREVFSHVMERRRLPVEAARNGFEAWQRVLDEPTEFDLIITDNQMPGISGLDLVQRLRTSNFPAGIILFSSTLYPEDMELAASLGVDAILEKGTPFDRIVADIRRVLRLRAAHRAETFHSRAS